MLSSIGLKQILCLNEDYSNLNYTLRIIQPISQPSIATEKEINAFIDRSEGILMFSLIPTLNCPEVDFCSSSWRNNVMGDV